MIQATLNPPLGGSYFQDKTQPPELTPSSGWVCRSHAKPRREKLMIPLSPVSDGL